MMDVASVQDSRMPGVLVEPFESSVGLAQTCESNDGFAMGAIPLTRTARNDFHFDEIVGNSEALLRVLEDIETVASTDSTVLIY